MAVYDVMIERDGAFWLVFIEGLDGLTQAHAVAEVPLMARSYIALVTGKNPDDITIGAVHVKDVGDEIARIKSLRQQAKESRAEATRLSRSVAASLRRQGASLTDIGSILGLSHQRVAQLIAVG